MATNDKTLADALEKWRMGHADKVPAIGEGLYTPLNVQDNYLENLGFPGDYPFTRGIQPTMHHGRLWTMRQYAGFGTASESNQRFRALLERGQTGLSVAFDLPTQMGRDADHTEAQGEVGRVGVSISSLGDMDQLFDGIALDQVSVSMTINATAAILLGLYVVMAERRGVAKELLRGTIQNDILKEYIARGTYIYPPGPSMRLTRDIFAWSMQNVPKWNVISISGYHMREAGSDAVQEVGFTLANAIAYLETAKSIGLDLNALGRQLSFFFNAQSDLFEEVAKYRAARRMWARIMKERFGVTDEKAQMLRFHAQTAGSSLQAQQPLVNVVRTAYQTLAAVLGGCQSLHANSFDEALALPTEESATLALRTQQTLAYETGVTQAIDPLGGSYFVEAMTDRIEKEAFALIAKIDSMGGMIPAIENGYVQKEIEKTAYQTQLEIERQERVIVGVNKFQDNKSASIPLHKIRPGTEQQQKARLAEHKTKRDGGKSEQACSALYEVAKSNDNVMPLLVEAIRAEATLGEISEALRRAWGTHHAG